MNLFVSPEKVYKDDVSLILDEYLEVNFNTICEDGSTEEVGELLCSMWRECCSGEFNLVHNALAREYVRHEVEVIGRSQGIGADGDADDDDEENNENNEQTMGIDPEELNDLEMESMPSIIGDGPFVTAEPLVANELEAATQLPVEDGWETIVKGKKSRRKEYRI